MAVTVPVTPPLCRKVAVALDALRQCTAMLVAVNTSRGSAPARTALLGHGQVGTATGVAVHRTGGGDAT
jgi:hypothetical protein